MVKNVCTKRNVIRTGAACIDMYASESVSSGIDCFERSKRILPHCIRKLKKSI